MRRVNDAFIAAHRSPGVATWQWSTYMGGNLALHSVTGDARYRTYAERWAAAEGYRVRRLASGGHHPDHQCAGEVYNLLNELAEDPAKVASIDADLASVVDGPSRDDWWWVDALHMAMPAFVMAAKRLEDPAYLTSANELYEDARDRRGLWIPATGLWYRDEAAQRERSPAGRPVLWSRGNGWAMAALAKVLERLGPDADRSPAYGATLAAMAEALRGRQRRDGFWNMNLADPSHVPGPETSGTAMFAFGIAYGIRSGRLSRKVFEPVVARAWNGMTRIAVQPDGRLGYVQPPARRPAATPPTATMTTEYAVGAFLLAGREIVRLLRSFTTT
jgi:unsaturated rhamnogalacturonyl hydrolase